MHANPFLRQSKILSQPDVFEAMRELRMFPVNVEIHPTLRCASRCKDCTYRKAIGKNVGLGPEQVRKALDDFARMGVRSITLSGGGEPLLADRECMEPILCSGLALGMNTSLACGAAGIKSMLDYLERFTWIRVSFDAYDAESYARRRQNKQFDAVMDRLRGLLDACGTQTTVGLGILTDEEVLLHLGDLLYTLEAYLPVPLRTKLAYILVRPYVRHDPTDDIDYTFVDAFEERLPYWMKAYASIGFRLISHVEKFAEIAGYIAEKKSREATRCYGSTVDLVLGADGRYYRCCELAYRPECLVADVMDPAQDILAAYGGFLGRDIADCPLFCKHHSINEMIHSISSRDIPHKQFI